MPGTYRYLQKYNHDVFCCGEIQNSWNITNLILVRTVFLGCTKLYECKLQEEILCISLAMVKNQTC